MVIGWRSRAPVAIDRLKHADPRLILRSPQLVKIPKGRSSVWILLCSVSAGVILLTAIKVAALIRVWRFGSTPDRGWHDQFQTKLRGLDVLLISSHGISVLSRLFALRADGG